MIPTYNSARGSGLHLRSAQDPGDTDPEVLASAGGREQQREDVAGGVVLVIVVFIISVFCFYFVFSFTICVIWCHLSICIELMNCFCWFPCFFWFWVGLMLGAEKSSNERWSYYFGCHTLESSSHPLQWGLACLVFCVCVCLSNGVQSSYSSLHFHFSYQQNLHDHIPVYCNYRTLIIWDRGINPCQVGWGNEV